MYFNALPLDQPKFPALGVGACEDVDDILLVDIAGRHSDPG